MDWGLFDYKDTDYKFLREEIVYSSTVGWLLLIFIELFCLCDEVWGRDLSP